MTTRRVCILVVGLLASGAGTAVAEEAKPTATDLARGKITGPFTFEAKATSDMVVHNVAFDAAGVGNTWHSHPPLAVIVKTGSYTVHTGDSNGCTSKTYSAGQVVIDPAGVTHVHEGSHDLELFVSYVGVPVGAAVAKDEAAPTGPNCPAKLATGLARTELSRSTIQGPTRAAATGDSDMLMQFITVPPGTALRGWFTTPGSVFGTMKSGSLTIFRGDSTSCISQTISAGQGVFVTPGEALFVRNDGSVSAEIYGTRLGLPVGAAPRVDAKNPGGANCPDVAGIAQPVSTGQLPRTGGGAGALVMLGLGLAGVGTITRVARRR